MNTSSTEFAVILPLVGVVIGGIIAATSSFLAGYLSDRRRHRLDMLRLRLQKLEDATCALAEIFDGCVQLMGATLLKAVRNADLPARTAELKNAMGKVDSIVSVYFPNLRPIHTDFVQKKGELAAVMIDLVSVYDGSQPGFSSLSDDQRHKAGELVAEKAASMIDAVKGLRVQMHAIADELTGV